MAVCSLAPHRRRRMELERQKHRLQYKLSELQSEQNPLSCCARSQAAGSTIHGSLCSRADVVISREYVVRVVEGSRDGDRLKQQLLAWYRLLSLLPESWGSTPV